MFSEKNNKMTQKLATISTPTNLILARLKQHITQKTDSTMTSYSRMHNRHNRS